MASSCCSSNVIPTLVLDEIIALSGETEIPKILYRVDGDDFYEICDDLRFIVFNNPFWKIMQPRIRTWSAGWPAAKSLRGGIGERVGRGGRGRRPREGNDKRVDELNGQGNDHGMGANGNLLPPKLAQVSNQGNIGYQNGNVVNENVRSVIVNGNRVGCSYKEFLACNHKEYDGKGRAVVLTHWIEKMESVHDMSGCSIDQKVKYTTGSFVGKDLMWWNSQIQFCPSHEMQKLESELWNHTMVGATHAAYTDKFHELA
nr:reverse transcriptase domain-containing protein [Tanacetum cinerariifolium]